MGQKKKSMGIKKYRLAIVAAGMVCLVGMVLGVSLWNQHQLALVYTPNAEGQTSVSPQLEEEIQNATLTTDSIEAPTTSEPDWGITSWEDENQDVADSESASAPEAEEPATQDVLTPEEEAQISSDAALEALYAVQDSYLASLEGLVAETEAEFLALPAEEQTTENKLALVDSKYEVISAMENSCDAQVEELLAVIAKAQLVLGNTDLVNEIRSFYAESKATWKADYMTRLSR